MAFKFKLRIRVNLADNLTVVVFGKFHVYN